MPDLIAVNCAPKEIRFTRARQAVGFWIVAALAMAATLTILLAALLRPQEPDLPGLVWALVPLGLAWIFAKLAVHCTRRAYLILTPLGVEIFPFFRPAKGMRLIVWQQVNAIDYEPSRLTLHFNFEKTCGVHLSLAPIRADRRKLLRAALEGRIQHQ